MSLIFVYGTLMSCMWNETYIKDSEKIGDAVTDSMYTLYISDCIIPKVSDKVSDKVSPSYPIKGELYRVSDDTLKEVDKLESKYTKKKVKIHCDGNVYTNVFMYFFENIKDEDERCDSGCFREYMEDD